MLEHYSHISNYPSIARLLQTYVVGARVVVGASVSTLVHQGAVLAVLALAGGNEGVEVTAVDGGALGLGNGDGEAGGDEGEESDDFGELHYGCRFSFGKGYGGD